MMTPTVFYNLVVGVVGTFQVFDEEKYTLSLGPASFQSVYLTQWGYLMAASAAVIAPIIVLFFFLQRYFIEGVTLTGMKN